MYLTHYGAVTQVPRLGAQFLDQLDQMVELGQAVHDAADRHTALKQGLLALYTASAERNQCHMAPERLQDLLAMDIELNAQGMGVWLDGLAKAKAAAR